MTEELVSLEVADLANEKGFNWPTRWCYDRCNMRATYKPDGELNYNTGNGVRSCPTQSLLQKWLREKHDLHVEIVSYWADEKKSKIIYASWIIYKASKEGPDEMPEYFDTYESALEDGLKDALKLIQI